jgi:hypothetical protein
MHVRMGDEVRFIKVIVVVGIISGDILMMRWMM